LRPAIAQNQAAHRWLRVEHVSCLSPIVVFVFGTAVLICFRAVG
jgi:hypothetical protein